jgi:hypothetical protein
MGVYLCAGLTAQGSIIKPAQRHKQTTIQYKYKKKEKYKKQKTIWQNTAI